MSVSSTPAQGVKYSTKAPIPADFSATTAREIPRATLHKRCANAETGEEESRGRGEGKEKKFLGVGGGGGGVSAACRVELLRFNESTVALKAAS